MEDIRWRFRSDLPFPRIRFAKLAAGLFPTERGKILLPFVDLTFTFSILAPLIGRYCLERLGIQSQESVIGFGIPFCN